MKILILGADGMIGHKMAMKLYSPEIQLILNSRNNSDFLKSLFPNAELTSSDFLNSNIEDLLNKYTPNFVLNCAGITIRRGVEKIQEAKKINSELPHKIDSWCGKKNKKLIHFSTDCVFSGKKGNYEDNDTPDAFQSYGLTKGKGEINSKNTLTIRSSMFGREIFNKTELLEWVLSQKNKNIKGFSNITYSGVTTDYMSNIMIQIIQTHPTLSGIYNVSSNPISKYDLILKINELYKLNIEIKEDDTLLSDKSLISDRFFKETTFKKPNWDKMLLGLRKDIFNNSKIYN